MKISTSKVFRLRKRLQRLEELLFKSLMLFSSCLIIGVLLMIIISIMRKGIPSLTIEILTQTPKGGFYFGKDLFTWPSVPPCWPFQLVFLWLYS